MNELIIQHPQFLFITMFLSYLLIPIIFILITVKLKKLNKITKQVIIIGFLIIFILITIYLFNYIDHRINTNIRK